jgi:uncharacterized membrane protein (DUF106 family)
MGLFNILDPGLDFLLSWIVKFPPALGLLVFSFLITLIITVIYKFTTDQESLKKIKEMQKKLQKEIKEARNDPKKAMKLNRRAMELNSQYMRKSFKSMIYTFLPIIILFGWMMGQFSFLPLAENEPFNLSVNLKNEVSSIEIIDLKGLEILSTNKLESPSGSVSWSLRGPKGVYDVAVRAGSNSYNKLIVVGKSQTYINPVKIPGSIFNIIGWIYSSREESLPSDAVISGMVVSNKPLKPLGSVSILGWKPGWLGTYIIFSILISMFLRKLLKVH